MTYTRKVGGITWETKDKPWRTFRTWLPENNDTSLVFSIEEYTSSKGKRFCVAFYPNVVSLDLFDNFYGTFSDAVRGAKRLCKRYKKILKKDYETKLNRLKKDRKKSLEDLALVLALVKKALKVR